MKNLFLILGLLFTSFVYGQQIPLTEHQSNGFTNYTSNEGLVSYLKGLEKSYPKNIKVGTYGKSINGTDLYYATLGDSILTPQEAHKKGKLVAVIDANIHGDERTYREALLTFMALLVTPGTGLNYLLKDIYFIITPSLNPDGFMAKPKATRKNAHDVDMNRDYMKLEEPELKSFVQNILQKWSPHLWVDGHNGGVYPYNVLYMAASHIEVNTNIRKFTEEVIFKGIDKSLKKKGHNSFFYQGPKKDYWKTGGHFLRIGRNYGGLSNIMTILLESPNWQDKKLGYTTALDSLKSIFKRVGENRKKIKNITLEAKKETKELKQLKHKSVVRMKYGFSDTRYDYLSSPSKDPEEKLIPLDKRVITPVINGKVKFKGISTLKREIPFLYLVDEKDSHILNLLRDQKIIMFKYKSDNTITATRYLVTEFHFKKKYNHPKTVIIDKLIKENIKLKTGTNYYAIPTNQILGRLVFQLLEPEAMDSLLFWNMFDSIIPTKANSSFNYPVLKIMDKKI